MNLSRRWMTVAALGIIGLIASTTAVAQTSAESADANPNSTAAAKPADPLLEQVNYAIDTSSRRYLTAGVHTPWQIMHGILALGTDFQLKQDGQKISALDWVANNATFHGESLFQVTQYGARLHPFTKPYLFEGHPNQFLAMLATCDLPMDHAFKVGNTSVTIAQIVKNSQMDMDDRHEITWSLWALSHYLEPDARWINKYNEAWSIERLVRIELQHSPIDQACGGTHGLFALTYARDQYLKRGKPLRGIWLEVEQKIQRYIAEVRSLQNRDGSVSASFFEGPKHSNDFSERMTASGHTLEWLMVALPDHRLKEDWVRRVVASVAKDLIDHRTEPAKCGALYHALHGLILYRNRVAPLVSKPETTAKMETVAKPVSVTKTTPAVAPVVKTAEVPSAGSAAENAKNDSAASNASSTNAQNVEKVATQTANVRSNDTVSATKSSNEPTPEAAQSDNAQSDSAVESSATNGPLPMIEMPLPDKF